MNGYLTRRSEKRGGTAARGPVHVCAKFNDTQANVAEVFESGPRPHKTASQPRLKRFMSAIMLPKHYSFVCFTRKQSSRVSSVYPSEFVARNQMRDCTHVTAAKHLRLKRGRFLLEVQRKSLIIIVKR